MRFRHLIYIAAVTALPSSMSATPDTEADIQLEQGLRAINKYDFKTARTCLEKYKALIKKAEKTPDYRADEALAGIPMAEDMLAGRVEKITVVDSLAVPKKDFFKAYRLSRPSGSLRGAPEMAGMGDEWAEMDATGPVWESEGGTLRYVPVDSETIDEEDGTFSETTRIYEGFRLDDGSWSEPTPLFDEDVDAAYPFMLSDGCTFYFASRSEQGLGGYDIFRSYRDSETGEFQNPVNMGLPYNSPADDYMLAIDEYTGAGWWATDRAGTTDEEGNELLTIYVFVPSEMRQNYEAETPGIKSLAALWTLHFPQEETLATDDDEDDNHTTEASVIPGWKLTWQDGADYSELLAAIQKAGTEESDEEPDFRFTGDAGRVYTSFDELPREARAPMQRYLEAKENLDFTEKALSRLRREYKERPSDAIRDEIEVARQRRSNQRQEARKCRNSLFQALRGY